MINHLEHSEKFAYNIQINTVSESDFGFWGARTQKKI